MNPAKAPWYFLGLQEMLVYFDPWIAGVVMPTLIIIGLMVIPYIDTNPMGSGYYTWKQRRFAISTLALSPAQAGVIWAGTNDGVIQRTADGGHSWQNVSPADLDEHANVVIIDGVPPGIPLSEDDLAVDLARRRPGQSHIVTQRPSGHVGRASGLREGRLRPNRGSDTRRSVGPAWMSDTNRV